MILMELSLTLITVLNVFIKLIILCSETDVVNVERRAFLDRLHAANPEAWVGIVDRYL